MGLLNAEIRSLYQAYSEGARSPLEELPVQYADYAHWQRQWFEHQTIRDERVEAFTSLLWEGVYNYSYVARATTPGVFVVPPSKAGEMYHPKTFGPKPSGAGQLIAW